MTNPIYEIVVFKAQDGITPDKVIEVAQGIQPLLESYTGYLNRDLIQTDSDHWVDIVTWQSLEDAQSAAEDIMKQPQASEFMSVLDQQSIIMMHGHVAFSAKQSK